MSRGPAHIKLADRRAVLSPPRNGAQKEQLLERQLSLKNVAFGQSKLPLDIQRRQDLTMQNNVTQVRGVFAKCIDNGIAELFALLIPRPIFEVIGRVLN